VVQWIKDLALSLQWLAAVAWFQSLAQELLLALGVVRKHPPTHISSGQAMSSE